jgi:hypothetical protein
MLSQNLRVYARIAVRVILDWKPSDSQPAQRSLGLPWLQLSEEDELAGEILRAQLEADHDVPTFSCWACGNMASVAYRNRPHGLVCRPCSAFLSRPDFTEVETHASENPNSPVRLDVDPALVLNRLTSPPKGWTR